MRIEGEPAKNPSLWIKKTEVKHRYVKVNDFWLPAENHTESVIRLGGRAILSIEYKDYKITKASPLPGNETARRRIEVTRSSLPPGLLCRPTEMYSVNCCRYEKAGNPSLRKIQTLIGLILYFVLGVALIGTVSSAVFLGLAAAGSNPVSFGRAEAGRLRSGRCALASGLGAQAGARPRSAAEGKH